ncbi:MAG: hypothetical protein PVH00_11640 [Gemmatimonadota bacterium]|jgi:hypothetical protein
MQETNTGARCRGVPAIALVTLLAACGGADLPRGDDALQEAMTVANEPEVCSLLSDTDIEDVLGEAPGPPDREQLEDAVMCTWRSTTDVAVSLVALSITRAAEQTYEEYLAGSEQLLGYAATPEQARQVEGPGRFNVWVLPDPAAPDRGAFQMFVAGYMIQIVAPAGNGHTALENCQAFARIIDQTLP